MEIFKALLMAILFFKEQIVLVILGIQDKDPGSLFISHDTHQHVSVYTLFCFPIVGVLMGKCIHSRKKGKWLQA